MVLMVGAVAIHVDTTPAAAAPTVEPLAFAGERIGEADWLASTDDYLAWVTAKPLNPGDPLSIMAYAEKARRSGGTWNAGAPSVAAFAGADGCDYEIVLTLKVKVPLVGERVAGALRPQLAAQLEAEFAANDAWLAAH